MSFGNLSLPQRRHLDKIIQAGLSHAATTLKPLLGSGLRIQVMADAFRCSAVAIRVSLHGALPGEIIMALPEDLARELVIKLTNNRDLSLLSECGRSALMEFGNILASAFVGYYDQTFGLRTLPKPPEFSLVMLDIPSFNGSVCASIRWSRELDPGQLLVGFEQSALDILLAE